jgi:hypothetical protein
MKPYDYMAESRNVLIGIIVFMVLFMIVGAFQ